jgi:hypothetical protein
MKTPSYKWKISLIWIFLVSYQSLKKNITQLLWIGCNGDIVTSLLRSLKKGSLIKTLICAFLSKHELSRTTSALIEYLDTDQKLNHLCWNGNGMSKDNMLSILKILKKNKTIQSLDLRKSGLENKLKDTKFVYAIQNILEANNTLYRFNIGELSQVQRWNLQKKSKNVKHGDFINRSFECPCERDENLKK